MADSVKAIFATLALIGTFTGADIGFIRTAIILGLVGVGWSWCIN